MLQATSEQSDCDENVPLPHWWEESQSCWADLPLLPDPTRRKGPQGSAKQRHDSIDFPLFPNTWVHALPSGLAWAHYLHISAKLPHCLLWGEHARGQLVQKSRGIPQHTSGTFLQVHWKPDQDHSSLGMSSTHPRAHQPPAAGGGTSFIHLPAFPVHLAVPWCFMCLIQPSPGDPSSSFLACSAFALLPCPFPSPSLPC